MIGRHGFVKGEWCAPRTAWKDEFQKVSATLAPGLCFEGLSTLITLILVLFTRRKGGREERRL